MFYVDFDKKWLDFSLGDFSKTHLVSQVGTHLIYKYIFVGVVRITYNITTIPDGCVFFLLLGSVTMVATVLLQAGSV
jgi:hypothetical protein